MFVHLTAMPGCCEELVERLCDEPAAATVSLVTGPFDFLVDCFAADQQDLADLAVGTFAAMPGVARSESCMSVKTSRTGSDYRSGTLDPGQARVVGEGAVSAVPAGSPVDRTDRLLLQRLCLDGRTSWAELGEFVGISARTARRRVDRLIAAGDVALRCDCSAEGRGPLHEVNLQVEVPAAALDDAAAYFDRLRGCRLSAQVFGNHNLEVTLWGRDLRVVNRYEAELQMAAPGARVVRRELGVRTVKRLGHVLDRTGRSVRVVPPLSWAVE